MKKGQNAISISVYPLPCRWIYGYSLSAQRAYIRHKIMQHFRLPLFNYQLSNFQILQNGFNILSV